MIPNDLKYTESHEWVKRAADGTLTIGITHHAQELLGDVVFVGLPEVGTAVAQGKEVVVVESVKAAADVYAPVAGIIVEVNPQAADVPESLNKAPYESWLFRLRPDDDAAIEALMDAAAYGAHASEN